MTRDGQDLRKLAARDGEAALQEAAARARSWMSEGKLTMARELLDDLLAASPEPSAARARALFAAGIVAFRDGDMEACRRHSEECVAVGREVDDSRGVIDGTMNLARIAMRGGDHPRAAELAREGRGLAGQIGDREAEAAPLHVLAYAVRLQGRYAEACQLFEESRALNLELGHPFADIELHNLGWVELHLGDAERARELFQRSASASHERNDGGMLPYHLAGAAGIAAAEGELQRAAKLLGAVDARLQELDQVLDPGDASEVAEIEARLTRELGANEAREAHQAGNALTTEQSWGIVT